MAGPRLWVANDHAAYPLKDHLLAVARSAGCQVEDLGLMPGERGDYPDLADRLAQRLTGDDLGLLICGSGIGISIAANRHMHLRAALVHDVTSARLAREHNAANVICMGGRFLGIQTGEDCLLAFVHGAFAGDRHTGRVAKLTPGFT